MERSTKRSRNGGTYIPRFAGHLVKGLNGGICRGLLHTLKPQVR
jgi:hypothetical protein